MNSPYIKQITLNPKVKHFIVGDIHGRYNAFMQLLDKGGYKKGIDYIYSVGDIIDRGKDSYKCIKFFNDTPNAHMVLGNHEYMVGNMLMWRGTWVNNGGVNTMDSIESHGKDFQWLEQFCSKLPWVLEVLGPIGQSFRIIHADFPLDWSDDHLTQVINSSKDGSGANISSTIWGRKTYNEYIDNKKSSEWAVKTPTLVQHKERAMPTYVGHTSIQDVISINDITFLDTFKGETLSMIEPLTKKKWQVTF